MRGERQTLYMRRALALLRNPSAAPTLCGAADWPLGLAGAALSSIGFYVWVLAAQYRIERALSFFSRLFASSLFTPELALKLLLLGALSLICLVLSLAAVGNRLGLRRRTWREIVAVQGGSQLMFGAGYLVSAAAALLSVRLSLALTGGLLLLNLLLLVIHSLELHEIETRRRFGAAAWSIAAYVVLWAVCWMIVF